jgi:hypothetical protein
MSYQCRRSLLKVAFTIRSREVETRARIAHHADNPELQNKLGKTLRDIGKSIEMIDAQVFKPSELRNLDL